MPKSLGDNRFVNIALILVGSFLLAFAVSYFLAPVELAIGGATGLATVLSYFFKGNIGVFIFVINIPIFIIGYISEGKEFLTRSLFGTIMLSVFSQWISYFEAPMHDMFLASVYGGVISGIGIGLAFLGGGTTGGTDIIAKVLNKRFRRISIGAFVVVIDCIVIIIATIAFGKLEVALYSGIGLILSSFMIDIMLSGLNLGKTAIIITNKPDDIIQAIHDDLQRGTTRLSAQGTYTGEEKAVLLCSFIARETIEIKRIVKHLDPSAFMILQNSSEIKGLGFE